MALTLRLERENAPSLAHLRKEPVMKPTVNFYKPGVDANDGSKAAKELPGFYKPDHDSEDEDDAEDKENEV